MADGLRQASAAGLQADADGPLAAAEQLKGRACGHCARLKMKCKWPEHGSGPGFVCARCDRLRLSCLIPVLPPRKKRGKSTRVAQLEQKIDGLVSLLAAGQQQQHQPPPPPPPETLSQSGTTGNGPPGPTSPASAGTSFSPGSQESASASQQTLRNTGGKATEPHDTSRGVPIHREQPGRAEDILELMPSFKIPADQAETYLDIYRREYEHQFPFVIIPTSTLATTLHHESPALFWVIMSVIVPQPSDVQLDVKKWVRQYIAEQVVVLQEKRLELLQVILIYLGWSEFHFFISSQATNLLQLALALVVDLKLDMCAQSSRVTPRSLLGDAFATFKPVSLKQRTSHSPDEMRAVLGYYHIASLVSALFKRGPQPVWSHHLAQCCDILAESCEYESDLYLVALVRIQRITDRVANMFAPSTTDSGASFTTAQDMAVDCLQNELLRVIEVLPPAVRQSKSFQSFYHILTMRLYEPIINLRTSPASGSDIATAEPFRQSECLGRCLQAAADFYEVQVTTAPSEILVSPSTSLSIVAYSTITTTRLLLREPSPGWDAAAARRRLDLAGYLKRLGDEYNVVDHVAEEAGRKRRVLDDKVTAFSKFDYKLRWITQWYLAKVRSVDSLPPVSTLTNGGGGGNSRTPRMDTGGEYPIASGAYNQEEAPNINDVDMWAGFGFDEQSWEQVLATGDSSAFGSLADPFA